ncbi:MAG: transcriptional regulator, GntR family [Ramlibacter sp.]|jgi:DNA-binding GntR family transcriptional regulator|nr:transcriptional regulator, GntR family [Ramlibacter sp.]
MATAGKNAVLQTTGPPARDAAVRPLASERQSDLAFQSIRRAIVRCELAPGRTVSEAEIEEHFKLKRAATRAALDRLATHGLLQPLHRRGYQIKPITLRDVNDLYGLREVLELAIVKAAAGRVDEVSLRRLDKVCGLSYKPGNRDSEDRFLRANSEFHLLIASATGNERLVGALAEVLHEMERFFHFGLAIRDRTAEMRHEHEALIEALSQGDAKAAQQAILEELRSSRSMVLNALMSSASLLDVSITAKALDPTGKRLAR